jgi:hypothetical protein
MKRIILVTAAVALAGTLSVPAQADPVPRTVVWQCVVEGEPVDFVVAPEKARDGIVKANSKAGAVFGELFGEDCHVE